LPQISTDTPTVAALGAPGTLEGFVGRMTPKRRRLGSGGAWAYVIPLPPETLIERPVR
jgi:hypothetical protein